MYDIRPLRSDEWRESRDLQLRALQDADAAVAFFETHDQALAKPEDEWRNWAAIAGTAAQGSPFVRDFVAVTLFGEWVATSTVLIRMAGDPELGGGEVDSDRGDFMGVWIDPHHRGQGLLPRLMGTAMTWLSGIGVSRAALHRLRQGQEPLPARPELGAAGSWLWMLTGQEPDPTATGAITAYLTSTVDHGFSASTFACRVVTSAGSDVASAVCGAIGTFAGPLHGGAPDRALDSLDDIGTPDRARAWVRDRVAAGERIMGFGHPVYQVMDPRAAMLREIAQEIGGPLVDLAVRVEQEVIDALAELKPGRQLHTNVEYYAGVVMELCGIPREMFTPTFATARVVGWGAHILEQSRESKIFRPAARYVGPPAPADLPR